MQLLPGAGRHTRAGLLLLRPLVPALQTVHPRPGPGPRPGQAGGLGPPGGGRVRQQRPLRGRDALLHAGEPRRLARGAARLPGGCRALRQVRCARHPRPRGGHQGRRGGHAGGEAGGLLTGSVRTGRLEPGNL